MYRIPAVIFLSVICSCKPTNMNDMGAGNVIKSEALQCDNAVTQKLSGDQAFKRSSECLFNRNVHTIKLHISGGTFTKLVNDACPPQGWNIKPTKVKYALAHSVEINGHKIENVGLKVRGNTSKCNNKRQFKIIFNPEEVWEVSPSNNQLEIKSFLTTNDDGEQESVYDSRRFYGLKGVSIRASGNDAAMIRERVGSQVFTAAQTLVEEASGSQVTVRGPSVYRAAFTTVWITFGQTSNAEASQGFKYKFPNDNYHYDRKGFYTLTENYDSIFLATRFAPDGKKKLKGKFTLVQADQGQGHFRSYNDTGYAVEYIDGKKPKGSKKEVAIQRMKNLITQLKEIQSGTSSININDLLDANSFIAYTAAAALTNHWDSLIGNGNNDYLFFNPQTKKWQVLVWDLDLTHGAKAHDKSNTTVYNFGRGKFPLFDAFYHQSQSENRQRLMQTIESLKKGFYNDEAFRNRINAHAASIANPKGNEFWLQGAEDWEYKDNTGYGHRNVHQDLYNFAKDWKNKLSYQ